MDLKVFILLHIIILMMISLIYCSQPQDTTVEPIANLTRAIYQRDISLLKKNINEIITQSSKPKLQYSVKKCYNCVLAIMNNAKQFTNYCIGKVTWNPPYGCTNVPEKDELCGDVRSLYVSTILNNFQEWTNQCGRQPQNERKTIYNSLPDIIKCGNNSRGNIIYSLCATNWPPSEDADDGNGKTDDDDVITDK
ncbi:uncharacterized protein LOC142333967 [Lycorma delicatula]|uniref:uncharacterized protein LOC142333967 n=1 Tax=Lycorma delicatula TaxID=130591 RepID=UPI003F512DBC